jgi:RimJ/RimL family protein N-acetyltransferase
MHPPLAVLPRFETKRLIIMPLVTTDADAITKLTNDSAIINMVNFLPTPFRYADAKALIGKNDEANCFLGAFVRTELIGIVGTHAHGDDRLEIGYWIGTKFQRQGYAIEAASGVVSLLRNLYPTHQVTAECRIENGGSWALLHKLGFRATGRQGGRPGRELLVLR